MAADIQSPDLVLLQTKLVTVCIKGPGTHPALPGVSYEEPEAQLRVACDDPYELETRGGHEEAGPNTYRLRPLFFEQQRCEIVIEPATGHKADFGHENYNIRKSVTPVGRSAILSGILNFGNDIGFSDLIIFIDGKQHIKLTVEVFPSKIGYKDDYKAITADVTAEVYNLVFDFLKKTYGTFGLSENRNPSPAEFFAVIRRIFGKFRNAADVILSRPHHILRTEHTVMPAHRARRTDQKTVRWIEKHPGETVRTAGGIAARRALAVTKHVTCDTNENRLTKYMLATTAKRLRDFKKLYGMLDRTTDGEVLAEIDTMVREIERRCSTGFLREVTASPASARMSLVFSMAPGYRELYRCHLMLQHGLSFTGDLFRLSVKDLAVLYEYWCFIKLGSLMRQRYQLVSQDVIRSEAKGICIALVKGGASRVKYVNPENGELITLSYNPMAIAGPTVTQRPDNVLSLEKKGSGGIRYEYVFDAKYRINAAAPSSAYARDYKTPGPQEDDINTMHRYRDAIVSQSGAASSPYRRMMFGAYVLFPYKNTEEYRGHHFYKSIGEVNIGGLPFLPSATGLVEELLDELISDSPDSAFERATLPRGIEKRLARVDWSRRDVLVCTFRNKEDLKQCLDKKAFCIAKSQVRDNALPVHYVALYQTKETFGSDSGIRLYGEVIRTELVEHQNRQDEDALPPAPFWRFTVREWLRLPSTIEALEAGFTKTFTNLFLLKHAEFVPELLLRSEAEYRFYSELNRRTGILLESGWDESNGFRFGNAFILFNEGKITVFAGGSVRASVSAKEFALRPNEYFRRLYKFLPGENAFPSEETLSASGCKS